MTQIFYHENVFGFLKRQNIRCQPNIIAIVVFSKLEKILLRHALNDRACHKAVTKAPCLAAWRISYRRAPCISQAATTITAPLFHNDVTLLHQTSKRPKVFIHCLASIIYIYFSAPYSGACDNGHQDVKHFPVMEQFEGYSTRQNREPAKHHLDLTAVRTYR